MMLIKHQIIKLLVNDITIVVHLYSNCKSEKSIRRAIKKITNVIYKFTWNYLKHSKSSFDSIRIISYLL